MSRDPSANTPAAPAPSAAPAPASAVRTADGAVRVTVPGRGGRPGYLLTVAADGVGAELRALAAGAPEPADAAEAAGPPAPPEHPLLLQLPGAVDRVDAPDETLSTAPPELENSGPVPRIILHRRSTAWQAARTVVDCTPEGPEVRWEVDGSGRLGTVLAFAVRAALGGRGGGLRPSGHACRTLFTPNPGPPRRLTRSAGESAVLGACGDARPGRGHWFFTPAPLCLALTEHSLPDDADPATAPAHGGWWTLGAGAPVADLTFTELTYLPSDGGFHLGLGYEGHTRVAGTWRSPALLVSPGHRDPYAGLRAHRAWLAARGWAPDPEAGAGRPRPSWWAEPMFCGWGAQSARAAETGRPAPELSTQAEYDAYLAHLADHGLVPGTVVIDDKWQRSYGSWEPDPERWPDLRGWIARRHAQGQKVLLWWRAWATEGVPEQLCVRTPDGAPVALDPSHPGARELLAANVARMLGPDGLDADGLKTDFTADTPTGVSLTAHGGDTPAGGAHTGEWGVALLHRQLSVLYAAAKRAKPDALVVTHTPHPAFAGVTDMIRLNDMLRLDDPDPYAPVVPQMRLRAAVARASCPGTLIDTDDWCAPDLEQWRAYCAVKHELGVPALYVASRLDRTGEPLEEADYAALREAWALARARAGAGAGAAGAAAD